MRQAHDAPARPAIDASKEPCDEAAVKRHAFEGGRPTLSHLDAQVTEIVRNGAEG